jgi:peptidyl-prolyl cis-trans isomerase B (cyclophilin B)
MSIRRLPTIYLSCATAASHRAKQLEDRFPVPTDKQRREAARRHLERQLQRRQEREAARKRFTLIASIVGSILLIAVVTIFIVAVTGDNKKGKNHTAASDNPTVASPSPSVSPTPSTSAAPLPLGTCKFVAGGTAAKKVALPANKASTKGTAVATVKTTQGTLTFTLDRTKAPCAVENFVSLARQKYFADTPCHRLVTKGIYVLQCGDPTGTGSGGPGYSFNDEVTGKEKYTTGVLAMANGGPNTNGSQFFIVYKNSTGLGPQYTVFGKVTGGMDVVDKVAAKGSDNKNAAGDGAPKLPVKITSVTVAG